MTAGGITSVGTPLPQQPAVPSTPSEPATAGSPYIAPAAGQDAGATSGGGLPVDEGTVRNVAIAGSQVAAEAQDASVTRDAVQDAAASELPGAGTQVPAGNATQGPAGPAAWNEGWMERFQEAGAPADLVRQLMITGANGADEAMLEQLLAQVEAQVEPVLAKFATDYPDEFEKLAALDDKQASAFLQAQGVQGGGSTRQMLVMMASAVESGVISEEDLKTAAEQAGGGAGGMGKMFFTHMLPWFMIPGWGAIRFALSPLFGGKDPISKEDIHLDFWNHGLIGWQDAALAVGGAFTIGAAVKGAMTVNNGIKLANAGGDMAKVASMEGVAGLQGFDKLKAFVPGTKANRVYGAIGRFDKSFAQGVAKLSGEPRLLAENVLGKWRAGEISIHADPALRRFAKIGLQPNYRGAILNRSKPMTAWANEGGRTVLKLDARLSGPSMPAHIAAAGVELAEARTLAALRAGVVDATTGAGRTAAASPGINLLKASVLGEATRQLQLTGPTNPLAKLWGILRPGPLQDALRAAENLKSGNLGRPELVTALRNAAWTNRSGFQKAGIVGLGVAGIAGWQVKGQMDAAKAAAAEAGAEGQAPAGQGAAAPQAELTPELEQAIQQFLALAPEQQQAVLDEQVAMLRQLEQDPNLSPEDAATVQQRWAELELLVAYAEQAAAAGAAPAAGGAIDAAEGAAQAEAPANAGTAPQAPTTAGTAPQAPASAAGITPEGMGLAPTG